MKTIQVEFDNEIAIVQLDRGITNAINLEMVIELGGTLAEIKENARASALVLGSTNDKFFSIGFDIPALYDLDEAAFRHYYEHFNQVCLDLYTFPKPTVAALSGHAIAGGCILALCCDYRFIAEGRKLMGLNEIKIGVPVPYLADRILHQLAGTRRARDIMESGEFYEAALLPQKGLVNQILPLSEVRNWSIDKARAVGALPAQAYAAIKHNRTEEIEKLVLANRDEKSQRFIDCWFSDEGRALLKAAIDKF